MGLVGLVLGLELELELGLGLRFWLGKGECPDKEISMKKCPILSVYVQFLLHTDQSEIGKLKQYFKTFYEEKFLAACVGCWPIGYNTRTYESFADDGVALKGGHDERSGLVIVSGVHIAARHADQHLQQQRPHPHRKCGRLGQ